MRDACIDDLPEEVMEYILEHVSPYNDLKNCMLVSQQWYAHVKVVIQRHQQALYRAVSDMKLTWNEKLTEPGPTITKRYAHSACYHRGAVYIFGGCTTKSTSFNDLWRLDLSTRQWVRPLAIGTYPSPKACATIISYKDNLVLFGGWSHPVPHPHQAFRIFNQLHLYNTSSNRWVQVDTTVTPPSTAAHSATVLGNMMVVVGGLQLQSNGEVYTCSNEVWVLDLDKMDWRHQETNLVRPQPRQSHSQINIDDNHILILGGCGGPNRLRKPFQDAWLLTVSPEPDVPWHWQELQVYNAPYAPGQLWWHPACKVRDKVVVLNKPPKLEQTNNVPSSLCPPLRTPRTWVPPKEDELDGVSPRVKEVLLQRRVEVSPRNSVGDDKCVNGKKGTLRSRSDSESSNEDSRGAGPSRPDPPSPYNSNSPSLPSAENSPPTAAAGSSNQFVNNFPYSSLQLAGSMAAFNCDSRNSLNITQPYSQGNDSLKLHLSGGVESPPSTSRQEQSAAPRNTPYPSVRPNSMKNRQRQLEGIQRMEEKLRHLVAVRTNNNNNNNLMLNNENWNLPPCVSPPTRNPQRVLRLPSVLANPMHMFVLNISTAVTQGFVSWLPVQPQPSHSAPEDTMLYSLVQGRGELIMFGGIQRSSSMSAVNGVLSSDQLSNSVYYINVRKDVV